MELDVRRGVSASPSTVDCAISSPYGVPFVRPSMRAAVFVMSPMTVYSRRRSDPTLPEMTSPVLRPDAHPERLLALAARSRL